MLHLPEVTRQIGTTGAATTADAVPHLCRGARCLPSFAFTASSLSAYVQAFGIELLERETFHPGQYV
eukprot:1154045-Pelagomonas_calceolata.AAC.2